MSLHKTHLNVPPEVRAVIKQLDKEEAISNLTLAKLGRRVPFNEKSICTHTEIHYEEILNDETGETAQVETIVFSEPNQSGNERLLFKTLKKEDAEERNFFN